LVLGQAFTPELHQLAATAQRLSPHTTKIFDVAFVNFYRDGSIHIPPHRDTTHGKDCDIVSFSFYQNNDVPKNSDLRSLCIARSTKLPTPAAKIVMENGSAVIMHPGMQQRYLHWVPPSVTAKWRINVTFRVHSTLTPTSSI
jgi:alkylated DNA repair dioxygenase AlkB